jgi:hypothetical protein
VGQSVRVKIAPRPLISDEHAALDLLLSVDFDGATDLRAQARDATVVGRCGCGCPTVDVALPDTAPAEGLHRRVSPVEGRVTTHGARRLVRSCCSSRRVGSTHWSMSNTTSCVPRGRRSAALSLLAQRRERPSLWLTLTSAQCRRGRETTDPAPAVPSGRRTLPARCARSDVVVTRWCGFFRELKLACLRQGVPHDGVDQGARPTDALVHPPDARMLRRSTATTRGLHD